MACPFSSACGVPSKEEVEQKKEKGRETRGQPFIFIAEGKFDGNFRKEDYAIKKKINEDELPQQIPIREKKAYVNNIWFKRIIWHTSVLLPKKDIL
ncbi:hypothetical protein NPIL_2591 [Nephila pilipes]|uniref:Uncharacterized protein n=1 Tax=Nephila pilipes TaxID=299642 RepID=A0A8X6NCW3_NEPPI|nr:hypothetical protein NPIL_631421 [Nephila pilipes]GFT06718.1 hypothetical protein NPIL_2591 [Nephila pilipes]